MVNRLVLFSLALQLLVTSNNPLQAAWKPNRGYANGRSIEASLKKIQNNNPRIVRLQRLATTPGGRPVLLVEMGRQDRERPAVLIVANMEGSSPVASLAALTLVQKLVRPWSKDLDFINYYIVVVGNPDGYANFFLTPLQECFTNATKVNDDYDDATDEDGPIDLNRDGLITWMRQVHPEGDWLEVEEKPGLLRKADKSKGEQGKYRVWIEGLDQDGDGRFAEDGSGGVNPGHNFPHAFAHNTQDGGPWAASEAETRGILQFAFAHPSIGMLVVFGANHSLEKLPKGRAQQIQGDKFYVPAPHAKRLGLDPHKQYALKYLVQVAREFTGMKNIDENMVLQYLEIGPASNVDAKDQPYWQEIARRFKEYKEAAGLLSESIEPSEIPAGSIEEWAYFQFGVPGFSLNFWALPKEKPASADVTIPDADAIEKLSNQQFIELGVKKIDQIIQVAQLGSQYTNQQVIQGVKKGSLTTRQLAQMLRKNQAKAGQAGKDFERDLALFAFNKKAFRPFVDYSHPQLGRVQIGGRNPWAHQAPPIALANQSIEQTLPFVRKLVGFMPKVEFAHTEVKQVANDIWRINTWIVNRALIPYPTFQGKRCKRPNPISVSIRLGKSSLLLEGRDRNVVGQLAGSGGNAKLTWLVKAKKGSRVVLQLEGWSAGRKKEVFVLGRHKEAYTPPATPPRRKAKGGGA